MRARASAPSACGARRQPRGPGSNATVRTAPARAPPPPPRRAGPTATTPPVDPGGHRLRPARARSHLRRGGGGRGSRAARAARGSRASSATATAVPLAGGVARLPGGQRFLDILQDLTRHHPLAILAVAARAVRHQRRARARPPGARLSGAPRKSASSSPGAARRARHRRAALAARCARVCRSETRVVRGALARVRRLAREGTVAVAVAARFVVSPSSSRRRVTTAAPGGPRALGSRRTRLGAIRRRARTSRLGRASSSARVNKNERRRFWRPRASTRMPRRSPRPKTRQTRREVRRRRGGRDHPVGVRRAPGRRRRAEREKHLGQESQPRHRRRAVTVTITVTVERIRAVRHEHPRAPRRRDARRAGRNPGASSASPRTCGGVARTARPRACGMPWPAPSGVVLGHTRATGDALHGVHGKRRRHAVGGGGGCHRIAMTASRRRDDELFRFFFQQAGSVAERVGRRRWTSRARRHARGDVVVPGGLRARPRASLRERGRERASPVPSADARRIRGRLLWRSDGPGARFFRGRRDRPRRRPTRRWPRRTTRGSSGRGPRLETRSGTATTSSCASGPQPTSARREWHRSAI